MPGKNSEKQNETRPRKAFQYRLYPTRQQEQTLLFVLRRCRELYNSALEERRAHYQMRQTGIGYTRQAAELVEIKDAFPAYQDIYSQVLQDVLRRVDKTFAAFFRRAMNGEKPGSPVSRAPAATIPSRIRRAALPWLATSSPFPRLAT